ncbi:MAG: hypothetical protein OWS74_05590 [Firmicutes bacterium]|nr:hypothetical protein [Bacillota bacterium]
MIWLIAALFGSAFYLWNAPLSKGLWNILAGLAAGLLLSPSEHTVFALACLLGAGGWLMVSSGVIRKDPTRRAARQMSAWYWQAVAMYLTAGLAFWTAVDLAREQVPVLSATMMQAEQAAARGNKAQQVLQMLPKIWRIDEMTLIVTMLVHGNRHGLPADLAMNQAIEMADRLNFDEEMRRRARPLWLTVAPALLLLSLLIVMAVPMGMTFGRSWAF